MSPGNHMGYVTNINESRHTYIHVPCLKCTMSAAHTSHGNLWLINWVPPPSRLQVHICLKLYTFAHLRVGRICLNSKTHVSHVHVWPSSSYRSYCIYLISFLTRAYTLKCAQPQVCGKYAQPQGEVRGWGRDPKKCTGRDWGMGSSTI